MSRWRPNKLCFYTYDGLLFLFSERGDCRAVALTCCPVDPTSNNGRTSLYLALGRVCGHGQIGHKREECRRLANEEPHCRQKLKRSLCYSGRVRRTNDRTCRQADVNEWARFG